MTINLYTNSSPKMKIGKSLTLIKGMTGTLREECDMINPSVLIENAGAINANYAHIPDFGRYYFITKITSVRNGLWRVDMHVDVRESFAGAIRNNTPIIERSTNYYDMYLRDDLLPLENDVFNLTYELGAPFDKQNVVLLLSNSEGSSTQPT